MDSVYKSLKMTFFYQKILFRKLKKVLFILPLFTGLIIIHANSHEKRKILEGYWSSNVA